VAAVSTPTAAVCSSTRKASHWRLGANDVGVEAQETWQSPHGARYPIRWHLGVPKLALKLDVAALVPNQELDLALRYWKGAVRLSGTRAGRPVAGYGYVELTGYLRFWST